MSLTFETREELTGIFIIKLNGSLDTNTAGSLETETNRLLGTTPTTIIFDFENLDYISSAGVRVVLKTKKGLKEVSGNLMMMNLQPQIKKVFEIINALPSQQVFSSISELDRYLDKMQRKITG
ncbi:anti-sigma factor antagonist [Geothermobacter hydrogeniphilus]|uniref:Anti-sigma factor antagonist n=1 Tax=Geothermobacter hydrogeniphilus TaxID=1969733 RepID=A0A2K2H8F8_9BACT|nr:STAS domain-containing protein [Geothermobacter hydrogeniphilus]PNU19588.1 anti-sigma factor antagonist [Geothermobacter hydrogeniphilus]